MSASVGFASAFFAGLIVPRAYSRNVETDSQRCPEVPFWEGAAKLQSSRIYVGQPRKMRSMKDRLLMPVSASSRRKRSWALVLSRSISKTFW